MKKTIIIKNDKYYNEIVIIKDYLLKEYPQHKVYMEYFVGKPSVILETKKIKLTFYIDDNFYTKEKWLYLSYDNKNESSGGGFGNVVNDLFNQINEFINKHIKDEKKADIQLNIFDFM